MASDDVFEITILNLVELSNTFDDVDLLRIIDSAKRPIEVLMRTQILRPTKKWDDKPTVSINSKRRAKEWVMTAIVNDEPYLYVSVGTRPHIIRPRLKKVLAFNLRTATKTRVNSLRSYTSRAVEPKIFSTVVFHPGSRPRHFDRQVGAILAERVPVIINRKIEKYIARRLR